MKTKPNSAITIKLDLSGDLGAQYLAAIKAAPFDITGREPDQALEPMKWTNGDDLPQHLLPALDELPTESTPSSWPHIIPVDHSPLASPWLSYTAPPEHQPWETVASANDAQDGWRFRAADDDGAIHDSKRVIGVTAGFVCGMCGREAKRFVHVSGESKARDACSQECQHGLDIVFDEWDGETMANNLTQMERIAVAATRVDIYNAIIAAGIASAEQMDALANAGQLNAEKFDMLIMTIWDGVRASMQKQSILGEIPF